MEEPLLPVSSPADDEEVGPAADVATSPSPLAPSPLPTSAILVRLASVVFLAVISLWASYEASTGFDITIVNGAAGTNAGRRFDLMFVSNDRASRAVLGASRAVERALYSDGAAAADAKKAVRHVILRLADGNLSSAVEVLPGGDGGEFLLQVSSRVMLAADAGAAMRTAVHRGMARVWLWDGQGAAPEALLDAMVEYLTESASIESAAGHDRSVTGAAAATVEGGEESLCWPAAAESRDAAVGFVRLCEGKNAGFVARLNRAMRGGWRLGMVEEALGSPPGPLCKVQRASAGGGWAALPVGGGRGGAGQVGDHNSPTQHII